MTIEASRLDLAMNKADVEALFQAVLRRPVNDDDYVRRLAASGLTLRDLLVQLRGCGELRDRVGEEIARIGTKPYWNPEHYRVPRQLSVSPLAVHRVLIVGSCLMEMWASQFASMEVPCENDLYLLGADLPEHPAHPIAQYDFQLVQMPLRFVLADGRFARLDQADVVGHEALFADCVQIMRQFLAPAMQWNRAHGILTFLLPFMVPQQNAVGRLMPRHDLRNPVCFVERLNQALADEAETYRNTYFFDFNEVLSSFGRRYVQEDMIALFNHGGFLVDFDYDHDLDRLEPRRRPTDVYERRFEPIMRAAWHELLSMVRTIRQTDMVKMVVLDLDDTLWRGVIAERAIEDLPTAEGWPRGLWEALAFLKRRGILLGLVSNNDESRVIEAWDGILGDQLRLDDFAIRRIDWRPKSERMAEILAAVNLLPRNVVFIDDNPVQRAEIAAAYPDMRVLGGAPFTWRHILLWSAETQTARVTAESGARTEMVQAQMRREQQRAQLPRAEFLAALDVRMHLFRVEPAMPARFARVIELINKTNQFNTTGRRWTEAELVAAMAAGLRVFAFNLADRHTKYGLVGVLLVDAVSIRQFVMSCRVMGLEAEVAAVARVIELAHARGADAIEAAMVDTSRNLPCRDVYARCGFTRDGDVWRRATTPGLACPAHIALTAPAA